MELSAGTISKITDAVCDAVFQWQDRPLEAFYPVIYVDAIRVKIRADYKVASRAAHIAVGVDIDGRLARGVGDLGPWPTREPPSGPTCTTGQARPGRGAHADRVTGGLAEAIETTWPDSVVPTCVVPPDPGLHAQRAPTRTARRPPLPSSSSTPPPSKDTALQALANFCDQRGNKYPDTVATWQKA